MKINLGFSKKRYTRDMSFDNNTTFGFGEVQPFMCQFMLPDSDIKVSTKQLVRLSPLVAPSFARVNFGMYARFVPMSEIYAPFESMLSHIPFNNGSSSFVPSSVPLILQNTFLIYLLRYCDWCISNTLDDSKILRASDISTEIADFVVQDIYKTFNLRVSSQISSSFKPHSFLNDYNSDLKFESCDFVFGVESRFSSLFTKPNNSYYIGLKIRNNLGTNFRKVLIGLGYDILSSPYPKPLYVSLLPLCAFYKAWYDTFNTRRTTSFTDTKCFALIKAFENNSSIKIDDSFQSLDSVLVGFFDELCECYYSISDDYISIHTAKEINLSYSGSLSSGTAVSGNPVNLVSGFNPAVTTNGGAEFDNYLLKTLKIFTNFVAKDSVIGQRMSDWVRTHFNAEVSNQLFKDSNFVHRSSMSLNISDVFSTSDTAQGSGDTAIGEHLGAYAGKGIGVSGDKFSFHSPFHGYLIVFGCIYPISRTFQGTDPTLLASSRFEFPQPEFDALGYEITDKRCFVGQNDLNPAYPGGIGIPTTQGFGYVPRYSSFKFRKNVCNGDMSSRSLGDTLKPYFLDRDIVSNYLRLGHGISSNTIPSASEEWRYITKYPWLSNFNRLFINDEQRGEFEYNSYDWRDDYRQIDNFIGQIIFNVSLTDSLKPFKQSYDTFDDERDTDVKSVESV